MPMMLVDYPAMVPGTCVICTGGPSPERKQWWDLMVSPWKMGRLYICSLCMLNAANELHINPNEALKARIEELEVENERGNDAIRILASLRSDFGSVDSEPNVGESETPSGEQGAKELIVK